MSTSDLIKSQTVEIVRKIVDKFEGYLRAHASEVYNRNIKWVDIEDIRWEKKFGLTGIHLIKVKFETDVGPDSAGLAVKIFDSDKACQEFTEKINNLQELMQRFDVKDVQTPKVLYAKERYLIMEGINYGIDFRDDVMPRNEAYRLAGRALALVHGHEQQEAETDRYVTLVQETMQLLPESMVDMQFKNEVESLFRDVVRKLHETLAMGGAPQFGDFHPGNVIFEFQMLTNKRSIVSCNLIDPEFLDVTASSDRFEDLTNFFITDAIAHGWMEITQLEEKLNDFLAGYEQVLSLKFVSLKEFYPKGFTASFQLGLGTLLSILNLLQFEDLQEGRDLQAEINYRLNLVKYLWQIYLSPGYQYWPLTRTVGKQ